MLAVSDVRAPERSMAKAQRVTAASALLRRLDRQTQPESEAWRSLAIRVASTPCEERTLGEEIQLTLWNVCSQYEASFVSTGEHAFP